MFKRYVARKSTAAPASPAGGSFQLPPPLGHRRPCSFAVAEDVSSQTAVKSSVIRGFKKNITDQYPPIEEFIDDIIPKKGEVLEGKG
jgi:hypothetical protein